MDIKKLLSSTQLDGGHHGNCCWSVGNWTAANFGGRRTANTAVRTADGGCNLRKIKSTGHNYTYFKEKKKPVGMYTQQKHRIHER